MIALKVSCMELLADRIHVVTLMMARHVSLQEYALSATVIGNSGAQLLA